MGPAGSSATPDERRIASLMSAEPIVVWPDTPLGEVADLLQRYAIGGVPVVDAMGFPLGVVSRLDVLRLSGADPGGRGWRETDARLAMTSPPVTIEADASLDEAARVLSDRRIHRLVVIDPHGGDVVGVVTASDLVAALGADAAPAGADGPAR